MRTHLYRWAVVALAVAAAATIARAGQDTPAPPEVKVDIRAEQAGDEPRVRLFINGQEVQPGQPVPVGAVGNLQVEARMDAGDVGASAGGQAVSGQGQVRVEVRGEEPGKEPVVRMWVNGKEVDPGQAGAVGGFHVMAGPGPRDDRPDRGDQARGERPMLGVSVGPVDDRIAEKADVKDGAVVLDVLPDTPAMAAGLRPGDVILSVNGKPIHQPDQLFDVIGRYRPGDRVQVEWSREGHRKEAAVTLAGRGEPGGPPPGPRDKPRRDEGPPPGEREPRGKGFLGVGVTGLTDETREMAGIDHGALISNLTDDSPAARAGLQAGDVITKLGEEEVPGPAELAEMVGHHKPGERVRVVYFRMGQRHETKVTLGGRPEGPGDEGRREGPRERTPLSDLPEQLFGNAPQIREYLEKLRPNIEAWAKQFQEQQGIGRPGGPMEQPPHAVQPMPKGDRPPYDVGKDMGRIIERLEGLERRINESERNIEERIRQLEKRLEREGR